MMSLENTHPEFNVHKLKPNGGGLAARIKMFETGHFGDERRRGGEEEEQLETVEDYHILTPPPSFNSPVPSPPPQFGR